MCVPCRANFRGRNDRRRVRWLWRRRRSLSRKESRCIRRVRGRSNGCASPTSFSFVVACVPWVLQDHHRRDVRGRQSLHRFCPRRPAPPWGLVSRWPLQSSPSPSSVPRSLSLSLSLSSPLCTSPSKIVVDTTPSRFFRFR